MKRAGLAAMALFAAAGCAKLWGFDDLSGTSGGGGSAGTFSGVSGSGGSTCQTNYRLCDDLCGEVVSNCGTVMLCDDCIAPQVCGAEKPNTCGEGVCVPSCDDKACGESNGCHGICAHGSCPEGQYCAGLACMPSDFCGINAPCPENDCASCDLYCSEEGRCCMQSYGCHADGDCCQGMFCDRTSDSVGTCRTASAGQRCSEEILCSFVGGAEAGACESGRCCARLSSYCSDVGTCCDGLSCVGGECCVPSQAACAVTEDCCGESTTCKGGVCCIDSGSPGCTSNADCCEGSPGCVAGSCK